MKDVDSGRPREPKGVEGVVPRVKHHALLSSVQVHYKVHNVNIGARPP
jgi:hypothetical protein